MWVEYKKNCVSLNLNASSQNLLPPKISLIGYNVFVKLIEYIKLINFNNLKLHAQSLVTSFAVNT